MPIVVNLDVMMAKRKMSLNELAERVDVTVANLSVLKNNHAKAVRFTTLEAICRALGLPAGRYSGICARRGGAVMSQRRQFLWISQPESDIP